MSADYPSAVQTTLRGSVGIVQLSSGVDVWVDSFFVQAMASNIGYILLGNSSSVVATTALAILDSGAGVEFVAGENNNNGKLLNLRSYFMVATSSVDKATLVYFN